LGTFRTTIIDFDTTGLSPHYGNRIIEVGAVTVEGEKTATTSSKSGP